MTLRTLSVVPVIAAASIALLSAQGDKTRTVWDGAYTDAQAARATATFSQSCSNCHTLAPEGNLRPLTGDAFWRAFTQKTVGDMLTFVKTNMPNGVNAGSLSPSTYNDLVALILKSNGFPAGTTEVSPESVVGIQIIPKDGPGELPANTLVRIVGCLAKNGSDWALTSATRPERIDRTGVGPQDASRALGQGSFTLKFVLTRLDQYAGQRMSVSGILLGAGGADGVNVTTVSRVAEACP
jgi:mono/diheme cytochrome c family protein